MQTLPLRLRPGQDLRASLESVLADHRMSAAFVLQGIGSLGAAQVRFASVSGTTAMHGSLEILTLAGSLAPDGAHLHIALSDAQGRVFGGHAGYGCIVRTTAEILIALLPDVQFSRLPDAESGYRELAIQAVRPPGGA